MSIKDIQPLQVSKLYSHRTPKTLIITPDIKDALNLITEMHVNDVKPIKFFIPDRFEKGIYFNSGYWKPEDFTFYPTHEKYDWKNIKNIMISQQDYFNQHKKFNYLHLVLELRSIDYLNNYIMNLMFNARNSGIQVTLIKKHPAGISPSIRSQFDYVFLDWYNQSSIHHTMYQNYATFLPNKKVMENLLLDAFQHHCLMVLDMRNLSPNIEDKILIYPKI